MPHPTPSSVHIHPCRIHIKNLRLRTYIGFNPEEREKKQDVIVNINLDYECQQAAKSDDVNLALNYKILTKWVIQHIETNHFLLLERMVQEVLEHIMSNPQVQAASVEIDKPHALRFSDSVSVSLSAQRD